MSSSKIELDILYFYMPHRRVDEWPLCPQCRTDNLISLHDWTYYQSPEPPPLNEWLKAGMRCTLCNWVFHYPGEQ